MVGDGSWLPVTAVGFAPHLPNVLVAPQMVHKLLSIRQFTADNSCSIEFNSSGFTVTARGPFTLFGFLLLLPRLRLLRLLLLP